MNSCLNTPYLINCLCKTVSHLEYRKALKWNKTSQRTCDDRRSAEFGFLEHIQNSAGNNFAFAARSVALASCVWFVLLFCVLRVLFRLLQRPRRPSGARKTCTWRRAAQYHWRVQWMSTRRRPPAHPFYGNANTLSRLAFSVVLG